MPKYFRPELDTPYTLSLKYPEAHSVSGFSGPELRWILSDGRAFYTPLDFADKLKAIGITKAYQKFTAIRRQNGRKADWVLSPASDTAGEARSETPAPIPAPPARKETHAVRVSDLRSKPPQKAATLIEQAGALDAPESYLEGETNPAPSAVPTALETALKSAVSAAAHAERHGQQIGYTVRFSPSDIRALGISLYIGMQQGRAA